LDEFQPVAEPAAANLGVRLFVPPRASEGDLLTPEERQFWRDGIYDQIREVMSLRGSLSIERTCELARVSRAKFKSSDETFDESHRTAESIIEVH